MNLRNEKPLDNENLHLISSWTYASNQHHKLLVQKHFLLKCTFSFVSPPVLRTIRPEHVVRSVYKATGCTDNPNHVIYLEHVVVRITITHPRRGDLSINLTSPSGTKSQLLANRYTLDAASAVFTRSAGLHSFLSEMLPLGCLCVGCLITPWRDLRTGSSWPPTAGERRLQAIGCWRSTTHLLNSAARKYLVWDHYLRYRSCVFTGVYPNESKTYEQILMKFIFLFIWFKLTLECKVRERLSSVPASAVLLRRTDQTKR